ncbi:OsmC family protein [Paenibacillus massiliensis]|uniref:OsmC family protein n=1 Tax=Paenibacillus massiliensis TaxID=225917 RepID=UPI000470506F|nr:OsmC family protein [Paenibacillus massiliensis]
MEHVFHLEATWKGGRNSEGEIDAGGLRSVISIPAEMGGPGTGTNPDEMLLGAASTCYIITLAAMMERAGLLVQSLALSSEGIVDVTNNIFTYRRIIHRPRIVLAAGSSHEHLVQAERLADKAEQSCMISRALAGNVELSTQAVVVLDDAG